jgi:hypothetical protein
VRELPGTLRVTDGYTDHTINRGFARARATLWFPPRVVEVGAGATPLVTATAASYGERDLDHPPQHDADDLPGPSVLAAASLRGRIVVVGSAESLSTVMLAGGASALDLWADQAVRWLAGMSEPATVGAKTPDQVRLIMTAGQRTAAIAACVAGIPLAWIVLGGAWVWWRRRRHAA